MFSRRVELGKERAGKCTFNKEGVKEREGVVSFSRNRTIAKVNTLWRKCVRGGKRRNSSVALVCSTKKEKG